MANELKARAPRRALHTLADQQSAAAAAAASDNRQALPFSRIPIAVAGSGEHPRKLSSTSTSQNASPQRSIEFAADRSPLQKLELELKHISKEEPSVQGIVRSLSRRQQDRPQRSLTVTSSPSIRSRRNHHTAGVELPYHGPNRSVDSYLMSSPIRERDRMGQHDGSGSVRDDYTHATPHAKPPSAIATNDREKSGSHSQGGQLHHSHHFFHWRKSHKDEATVVQPAGPMGHGNPILQVARLTIEDGELEELALNETESHDSKEKFPHTSDGPADTVSGDRSITRHHSHHGSDHDSNAPSRHHHPEHLQAPHTSDEREAAMIMAYLHAIPVRVAPDPKAFRPRLNLKCGPLLRYIGLRRNKRSPVPTESNLSAKEERETWRGTVMIVTTDEHSDYLKPPSIRIFHVDSVAEANSAGKEQHESLKYHSKHTRNGEKLGKYEEIGAVRLHAERGVTFWRFNIEIELSDKECQIVYRINHGPKKSFWVPARGQTMNMMFHSCNGFSLSVNPDEFCGPDPLWKDVLNAHQARPFHVMIGGGDQST